MEPSDNYEVRKTALKKKLGKLSSKSDLLKKISHKENKEYDEKCELARKVVWEALEEYEEGDYTWDEMVSEIHKSLKALAWLTYKSDQLGVLKAPLSCLVALGGTSKAPKGVF